MVWKILGLGLLVFILRMLETSEIFACSWTTTAKIILNNYRRFCHESWHSFASKWTKIISKYNQRRIKISTLATRMGYSFKKYHKNTFILSDAINIVLLNMKKGEETQESKYGNQNMENIISILVMLLKFQEQWELHIINSDDVKY